MSLSTLNKKPIITGQRRQLYTRMKVFHFQQKLDSLSRETDAILPPVHVRVKPTNVCNHRCSYCAYRAESLQLGCDMNQRDSIPRDKIHEIIDDFAEMGVGAVTFSGGGEPFCWPHLAEAANQLSRTSISFAALTNGARLTNEVAAVFAHHATWLRVSIDGWDDVSYARYRNVAEGEFTRVMNNMKAFKQLGGACYLGVSLIVDAANAPQVYNFIARLRDIGVDSVKVSPCIISNDGAENNVYHAPFFAEVKCQIARALDDFVDEHFEIFDAYHELDEKFTKDYTWCPYLQILPVIGADLNVYSCQDKAYNLAEGLLGSIKNQRFRDFWMTDKEKFFTINPSVHCNHHCVANGKNKMVFDYLNADPDHLAFV
jgi:MoaA/NifB/PqqE/SkfB family radical SAM enzyme